MKITKAVMSNLDDNYVVEAVTYDTEITGYCEDGSIVKVKPMGYYRSLKMAEKYTNIYNYVLAKARKSLKEIKL